MSDKKLSEVIQTSLDQIKSYVDAQTIIGDEITTSNGTVIIPVTKLFVGYASGGIDYTGKAAANNFGGGGGTGVTVSPVAFLVVTPDGKVDILNVNEPIQQPTDPVSQIVNFVENSPELIEKFKKIFAKEKPSAKENLDDLD